MLSHPPGSVCAKCLARGVVEPGQTWGDVRTAEELMRGVVDRGQFPRISSPNNLEWFKFLDGAMATVSMVGPPCGPPFGLRIDGGELRLCYIGNTSEEDQG